VSESQIYRFKKIRSSEGATFTCDKGSEPGADKKYCDKSYTVRMEIFKDSIRSQGLRDIVPQFITLIYI
jgi:hypothetical protein